MCHFWFVNLTCLPGNIGMRISYISLGKKFHWYFPREISLVTWPILSRQVGLAHRSQLIFPSSTHSYQNSHSWNRCTLSLYRTSAHMFHSQMSKLFVPTDSGPAQCKWFFLRFLMTSQTNRICLLRRHSYCLTRAAFSRSSTSWGALNFCPNS